MIDDMLQSFDDIKISKQVECNLSKFEEHLMQIMHKTKANADTIQKDKADILHHIHSLKSQLIAKLQKIEDDIIVSLETRENRGSSLIIAIHSDLTQLELLRLHGSEVQKLIMLHNMDQAIYEYQQSIKEIRISLDVDKTFQTFVNTLRDFGTIALNRMDFDWSPCPGNSETRCQTVSLSRPVKPPLKEGKTVKVSEFNVKESGDKDVCHISDILHLKDCRILLVDKWNSKIKMFGQDYKYQENMPLQGGPWSACSLYTEVAVTIPDHKTIQIIAITEKMLKVRDIRTRLHCWGIAVVKDQLVITTYQDAHSILILDMLGKEIRTVRPNTYLCQTGYN
ncbi:hypothetical protein CHS0354_012773 [Potamilus streckersoni]|uniref:Uncharacterized protein n=1 Tax=Potamilus streckersoni TaxID=2493646 RepID=A0AAE0VJT2_9BIVA|nr:hypothetical protein CHS0354_012773 [Potamilus streckersoni]